MNDPLKLPEIGQTFTVQLPPRYAEALLGEAAQRLDKVVKLQHGPTNSIFWATVESTEPASEDSGVPVIVLKRVPEPPHTMSVHGHCNPSTTHPAHKASTALLYMLLGGQLTLGGREYKMTPEGVLYVEATKTSAECPQGEPYPMGVDCDVRNFVSMTELLPTEKIQELLKAIKENPYGEIS